MAKTRQNHIVIDARNRRSSTGRYTARLLDHLQQIDTHNRYTVLVESTDPWQPIADNFQRLDCDYEQFSFSPLQQLGFARQLYQLKPDLVHFTMTQQPLLYFGKIVTTTHDLTMLRYTRPSRFPRLIHMIGIWLYRFLMWSAHKRSNRIIVPTKFVAQDVESLHPFTKDRLSVTYEASEPPTAAPAQQPEGIQKPFIMHIGAPFPHKNINRLIKAFEIVRDKNPDLNLVLPGKMKNEFKQDFQSWREASQESDYIIAPGFVSDEELKWLLENAAAYVLPSLSEGFGLPGLEAMVHGCPVVSSNATCLPEVYGDAAVYFDPEDIDDMAKKIDSVISDPELRKELIDKGYAQAKKYSWRTMSEQTLEVYQEVLTK